MNPYVLPTFCSVCGEEGMLHGSYAVYLYNAQHRNPQICIENLKRKCKKLKMEKEELEKEREKLKSED